MGRWCSVFIAKSGFIRSAYVFLFPSSWTLSLYGHAIIVNNSSSLVVIVMSDNTIMNFGDSQKILRAENKRECVSDSSLIH